MKTRFDLVVSLAAIVSILLTAAASMVVDDPHSPEPPEPGESRHYEKYYDLESDFYSFSSPQSGSALPILPDAPQATPGQPGLFFHPKGQIGVTNQPYPASANMLNYPTGLFIDAANNVYVAENEGGRVLRYNSSGLNSLSIGVAGAGLYDYPGRLYWPHDIAVESNGKIWVVDQDRLLRFSAAGALEMSFPPEGEVECLSDNDHLCIPTGIAISSAGVIFVADNENHRIQVFTKDVSDNPVYSATIGTGTEGSGANQFSYPEKLAIDTLGNLYVADSGNHRIQKCTTSAPYTCSTFHGGVYGDDINQLAWPLGIGVDAANNVYIADTDNWRVKKCTSAGACSVIISDILDPRDIVVDSSSNVYISQGYNMYVVGKFTNTGSPLGAFAGTIRKAYNPMGDKIYSPQALGVDTAGNVYAAERYGNRWLKFNSTGALVWAKGEPGLRLNDSDHFGDSLMGNPGFGPNGRLYLPAGNQRCVRLYNLEGVHLNATIGQCQGSTGDSGTLLGNVGGVAVSPLNNNVYVVDRGNNKVKIYDVNHAYLGLLGQGSPVGYGTGSYQFKQPIGIAIDKQGNIYVADRDNHRVQKYNSSGVYQLTFGVTGLCERNYDTVCAPSAVAVDAQNHVYIVENWRHRISIFDSNKNFLASIGSEYGDQTGRMRTPAGVAVTLSGLVYVAERENHRISRFEPGWPQFGQVNVTGFGDYYNTVLASLEPFNNALYAGTNNNTNGAEIWKMDTNGVWTSVETAGFGDVTNASVNVLKAFDGKLYAGIRNNAKGGQIYRSMDGSTWEVAASNGLGLTTTMGFYRMEIFNNSLYVVGANVTAGASLYRTTNGTTWDPVVTGGLGDISNTIIRSTAIHNNALYLGMYNVNSTGTGTNGAKIYRSSTGDSGSWQAVSDSGFGAADNYAVMSLASFNGYLYAAVDTWNPDGIEVWRCDDCSSQADWEQVVNAGFGNVNNTGNVVLQVFQNRLYLVAQNFTTGLEVWVTDTGENGAWSALSKDGFGNYANRYVTQNGMTIFNNNMYIGTQNNIQGSQVWVYQNNSVFLPIARK